MDLVRTWVACRDALPKNGPLLWLSGWIGFVVGHGAISFLIGLATGHDFSFLSFIACAADIGFCAAMSFVIYLGTEKTLWDSWKLKKNSLLSLFQVGIQMAVGFFIWLGLGAAAYLRGGGSP